MIYSSMLCLQLPLVVMLRAMSIEDEQHNKKSILTHPFFHTAFPAGEELAIMMMMIAIIKEAFRQLYIIYRDQKNGQK